MADKPLTIVQLDVTNFARIKAISITPSPTGAIIIAGRNAQGKSSVLDAIATIIDGARHKVPVPVHAGEKEANIVAAFGRDGNAELIVKWRMEADGGKSLVVEDALGHKKSSPAKLMKSLFGYLSVDPFAFANSSGKDQLRMLLTTSGFDMDDWDVTRGEIFNTRTDVNREVTRLKKYLESIPPVRAGVPDEPVSSADLLAKRKVFVDDQAKLGAAKDTADSWASRVTQLEDDLLTAKKNLQAATEYLLSLDAGIDFNGTIVGIDEQLANIDATNEAVRAKKAYTSSEREFNAADDKSKALSEELVEHDKKLAEAIAEIDLPIKGLSYTDEELRLNDIAFEGASHAEKLKIGTALAIAAQPSAGVILIEDGHSMDSESMEIVTLMAKNHDMQVWIETINAVEDGIVIEDGGVLDAS